MFVRFAQNGARLKVSLIDGRRDGSSGHVASLGSIAEPMSAAGRTAFWAELHRRLGKLGDRVGGHRMKVLAAVHARVPIVTQGEAAACDAVEAARTKGRLDRVAKATGHVEP
jgi:hypothetical protein